MRLKMVAVDRKAVKLQIWDTAGQERYRYIASNYYKGASGIILCYSITELDSFKNVKNWMEQIELHAPRDVVKLLIGTKNDLKEDRQVTYDEGNELAQYYGIQFYETSAKDDLNISEAFYNLASQIKEKFDTGLFIDREKNEFNQQETNKSGRISTKNSGRISAKSSRENEKNHSKCC